jgi:peroxiredoxin
MGAFRREQADLAAAGLPERIAAVGTPLAPDGSLSTQVKNDLAFAVVSDPGNRIAARLGIVNAPTEPAHVAQLQLGLDLIAANADGTVTLPMPTTAILDGEHVLRWFDVHRDYSARSEPQQILDALDQLHL